MSEIIIKKEDCLHEYFDMKVEIVDTHDGKALHLDVSDEIGSWPIAMCPWCGKTEQEFMNIRCGDCYRRIVEELDYTYRCSEHKEEISDE